MGVTIGSSRMSTVVVPASFLEPVHVGFQWTGHYWWLLAKSPTANVTVNGRRVVDSVVVPGEIIRLAGLSGTFVTVRAKAPLPKGLRMHELRCSLPIPGSSLSIGSASTSDVILDHPMIRPLHALIHTELSGHVWIEDQATVAGTYINGARIRGKTWMSPGDVVQVGPYSAKVGTPLLEPLPKVAGVDIAVRRASLTVGRHRKQLLNNVQVRFAPGTLTAIAGPSGAGKTTLLKLAAGQTSPTTGEVTYDNLDVREVSSRFTPFTGFVPQDDIVHGDLTVAEALRYQATLRLGGDIPRRDREMAVVRALEFVELVPQANQLIRTLSGGQRKRVSVATELISDPQLLFLDEPTSGLDPGLDKRMMLLLRLLADGGRTVILTTHAVAHVDVCDQLVLVGPGGSVIYAGPPRDVCKWFGVDSVSDVYSLIDTPEAAQAADMRRPRPVFEPIHSLALGARSLRSHRRSVILQVALFVRRNVKLMARDKLALAFALLQGLVVAVLAALVRPSGWSTGGWGRNGITYCTLLACSGVWIGVTASVRELVKERNIWRRESLVGAKVSAYLASKVIVLFGLALIQALSTVAVIAATLGLPTEAGVQIGTVFSDFLVTIFIATIGGTGLGLLVSAYAPSSDRAMSFVPYLLIPQFFLSGTFFALGPLEVLSFVIPARWGSAGLGSVSLDLCFAGVTKSSCPPEPVFQPIMVFTDNGLVATWSAGAGVVLTAILFTAFALHRQSKSWSVG